MTDGRVLLLLTVFCLALFTIPAIVDRGLTVHEAVLPQSARTMYHGGDYLVPRRGTAPWLENPPLPQWVTVGLCHVVGTCTGQVQSAGDPGRDGRSYGS